MDTNNIIPSDISETCCANFLKDAAVDMTKQRPCNNNSKFVVKGSVEYGRLFTMTGAGDTIIAVCGTHFNLLDKGKKINVHYFVTELTFVEDIKEEISRYPMPGDIMPSSYDEWEPKLCSCGTPILDSEDHCSKARITCAVCKNKHHTIDEVRACQGVVAKPKADGDYFLRNKQVRKVSESYVRRMWQR